MIATSSFDSSARIWDATNGALLFKLSGLTSSMAMLAWSPIDKHLAIAGSLAPRVWDLSPKSLRLSAAHTDGLYSALWSPDGTRIGTTSMDHTARIWDASNGQDLLVLTHPTVVHYSDWSPDGKRFVTASNDGISRVWDVTTGKLLLEHRPEGEVADGTFSEAESWSPDGSRIATPLWPSRIIEVWDAATGKTLFTVGDGSCIMHRPAWSPQGDRFASGCASTEPPDDNLPVRVWDGKTGQLLMTLESHDGESMRGVWSPDGTRLVVPYEKGPVKVWDATTGTELLTFGGHSVITWDAIWSPDGKRIASSDDTGNIKVWDASTGEEVMSTRGPGGLASLSWSPDGHYLLGAGNSNAVFITRVWQSTDELIQYAKECCVARELTAAERQQFGLAVK